jgi:hypothetical protein
MPARPHRFSDALPLLEQVVADPHAGFQSALHIAQRLAPRGREQAAEWLSDKVARWPAAHRVVGAPFHDPIFWPLACGLRIEARRLAAAQLERDLTHFEQIFVDGPTRAVLDVLARRADPRRWKTLSVALRRKDARAADAIAALPLDRLARVELSGRGWSAAVLARTHGWTLPALRELVLHEVPAGAASLDRLVAAPWSARLAALSVGFAPVTEAAAARIATLSDRLEELALLFVRLSAKGLGALLRPRWPSLRRLDLGGNPIGLAGTRALLRARDRLPELVDVALANTGLTDAWIGSIASSPWMARGRRLTIGGGELRPMSSAAARALLERSTADGPVINDGMIEQLVDGVTLVRRRGDLAPLCRAPGLAHVRRLTLPDLREPSDAALLATCERLAGLRSLVLLRCALSASDLGPVLRNPALRDVQELELSTAYERRGRSVSSPPVALDLEGVRALATSGLRPRRLELAGVALDDRGAAILAGGTMLEAVEELDVSEGRLTHRGLERLLAAAPNLHTIFAGRNPLGAAAGAVLAASGRRFEHLALSSARLGDEGVRGLLASPRLGSLRALDLAANRLSDASADALVAFVEGRAPLALSLSANHFGARGLARLRRLTKRPFWADHGSVFVHHNRSKAPRVPAAPVWITPSIGEGEWAFAGTFALGHHSALVARVRALGGRAQKSLRPTSTVVAVGARPGKRLHRALARGLPLVSETALYAAIGAGSLEAVIDERLAPLDATAWTRVCDAIERWPDATVRARIDRLRSSMRLGDPSGFVRRDLPGGWQWHSSNVRRAPRRWVRRCARRGAEPRLLLANGIDVPRGLRPADLARLLSAPELEHVRVLRMTRLRLDAAAARALDDSALSRGLSDLAIIGCELDAGALCAAAFWERLAMLRWEPADPGAASGPLVLERLSAERARVVRSASWMTAAKVRALFGRGAWPVLEDLGLALWTFDAAAVRAFGDAALPRLTGLSLQLREPPERALRDLFMTPPFARLDRVALYATELGAKTIAAWAESPFARPGARLFVARRSVARAAGELHRLSQRGVECVLV